MNVNEIFMHAYEKHQSKSEAKINKKDIFRSSLSFPLSYLTNICTFSLKRLKCLTFEFKTFKESTLHILMMMKRECNIKWLIFT